MPSKRKAAKAATEAEPAKAEAADKAVEPAPEAKKAEDAPAAADAPAPEANGEAPAVNGQKEKKEDAKKEEGPAGDKKEDKKAEDEKKDDDKKDGDKKDDEKKPDEEKETKKPVKKTIPRWATVAKTAGSPTKQAVEVGSGGMAGAAVGVMEELTSVGGSVSSQTLKKELMRKFPNWKKWQCKKAVVKAVEKGRLKQVKGSFKLLAAPKAPAPSKAKKAKNAKNDVKPTEKLDDLLGNIFTWVCEPKESSISLIRKYIEAHHTKLSTEKAPFTKAIESGIKKGQLERLNGAGLSGTVALVDKAKKTGAKYEDAIEDAIIACNEPKDASIPALRHYLSEYHTEYNVAARPNVLFNCLERCEAKGWIKRITGRGKSGSFRLVVPYRPSPKDLWRDWYEEDDEPKPKRAKKPAKVQDSSDEEESSEEEESESEEESDDEPVYVPRNKKRGPPTPRATVLPKKKAPAKAKASKAAPKTTLVTAKKSKPPPPPKKKAAAGKKKGRK